MLVCVLRGRGRMCSALFPSGMAVLLASPQGVSDGARGPKRTLRLFTATTLTMYSVLGCRLSMVSE